ncbi:uncharacterized protein LOC110918901 [Helianthus annuus]|uniref:uncharacterized protein LOC110918901 n=1 Tax=Helianthus annuus TaxID=4232 RepID=UPI00165311B9|nr:uncharacterized protein LOC110918901 [Helianthus annuus]
MAMFSTFLYFSSVAVIHVLINIETLPINSTSCFLSLPSVAGFMSLNMEQHPGFLLLNMEQQVEDATMDKAVKVASMDNSFFSPIVCKPTNESDKVSRSFIINLIGFLYLLFYCYNLSFK